MSSPILTWRMSILSMTRRVVRAKARPTSCERWRETWREKKEEIRRRSARVAAGMETPEAEDRDTPCVMKKVPTGHYKWDDVSACFPVAVTNEKYFKYYCAGTREGGKACRRRIRTFCACSPVTMLCEEHYAAHRAARWSS